MMSPVRASCVYCGHGQVMPVAWVYQREWDVDMCSKSCMKQIMTNCCAKIIELRIARNVFKQYLI